MAHMKHDKKYKIIKGVCLHDLKHLLKHKWISQQEYEKFLASHEHLDVCENEDVKHWVLDDHCTNLFIPQPYPDLTLPTKCGQFYYKIFQTAGCPDSDYTKKAAQLYNRSLTWIKLHKPATKTFLLNTDLLKFKWFDPMSRLKATEMLCDFLSSKEDLDVVILENAELSTQLGVAILLAISLNSGCNIRELYLCRYFKIHEDPHIGYLTDSVDNVKKRMPLTKSDNAKLFLAEISKNQNKNLLQIKHNCSSVKHLIASTASIEEENISEISNYNNHEENLCTWTENLTLEFLKSNSILSNNIQDNKTHLKQWITNIILDILIKMSSHSLESLEHVSAKVSNLIKCETQNKVNSLNDNEGYIRELIENCITRCLSKIAAGVISKTESEGKDKRDLIKNKIKCLIEYVNKYKHCRIERNKLIDMYRTSFSGLNNLSILSVNFSYIADGTGKTLLSIDSIVEGKLKTLKILCTEQEIPSSVSRLYSSQAYHIIPDYTWNKIFKLCPALKVHMFFICLSGHYHVRKFLSKSIPLDSFQLDTGLYSVPYRPDFDCIFRSLMLWFPHTLTHISIVKRKRTGEQMDGIYLQLIENMNELEIFEYYGQFCQLNTVQDICNYMLNKQTKVKKLIMKVQEQSAQNAVLQETMSSFQQKYGPHLKNKGIDLILGTCII